MLVRRLPDEAMKQQSVFKATKREWRKGREEEEVCCLLWWMHWVDDLIERRRRKMRSRGTTTMKLCGSGCECLRIEIDPKGRARSQPSSMHTGSWQCVAWLSTGFFAQIDSAKGRKKAQVLCLTGARSDVPPECLWIPPQQPAALPGFFGLLAAGVEATNSRRPSKGKRGEK